MYINGGESGTTSDTKKTDSKTTKPPPTTSTSTGVIPKTVQTGHPINPQTLVTPSADDGNISTDLDARVSWVYKLTKPQLQAELNKYGVPNDGNSQQLRAELVRLARNGITKSPSLGFAPTEYGSDKLHKIVKEDENFTGIAKFKDFCISLLKWIATQVGFHYAIRLIPDPHEMCLLSRRQRRADQGVASMTVNYARESVIDFTKPFMNLGIGILFKTSRPLSRNMGSYGREKFPRVREKFPHVREKFPAHSLILVLWGDLWCQNRCYSVKSVIWGVKIGVFR
ncbi:Glutamate receptor ionotropic, kainate 1 [Homalodisca vitripennis]|nr:Glutamate receptor ionotropic, kainate 1 [Homalodisca vitripennis]